MATGESNFFATLDTSLSRRRLAKLFATSGWRTRPSGWTDFEATSPFAELVIEGDRPILLHGLVDDIEVNADPILALLHDAGINLTAECYDDAGRLLREIIE